MTKAKLTKSERRSTIAQNLRTARLAAGFETVSDAARFIGIPVPTAIAHEGKGSSFRNPKLEQLRRYAAAYKTTIDWIEGGTIVTPGRPAAVPAKELPPIENLVGAPVLASAAAGLWLEVDPFKMEAAGTVPVKADGGVVVAVNIVGDSMNKVIQDGDVAIVRPWKLMKRDPKNNDVLLVEREREGKFELTVKTYRDGLLWPESTNPKWRHPLSFKNGDTVVIVGLVTGLYRPL
jgi:SOS-response transcriptional repressor LexA